jgi:hypothetical protein
LLAHSSSFIDVIGLPFQQILKQKYRVTHIVFVPDFPAIHCWHKGFLRV